MLAAVAVLLAAGPAQATTRYAAPGGTGIEPCINPQRPCTIYLAADATPGIAQVGDEVVMAPGEYTDTAGDLGPSGSIQLVPGISVHGEAGAPRPLVSVQQTPAGPGAFVVEGFDTLSHVEIDTSVAKSNLAVLGGTVDDTIVRNTSAVAETIACMQVAGTIRDSVCLASGAKSVARSE